jgi:hypothetical protein
MQGGEAGTLLPYCPAKVRRRRELLGMVCAEYLEKEKL